ncbi:hypothetical protein FJY63_04690 [Candidatus Sumerlaeota bacterium]|nr:hypothetical protein [Candidatus Sumerlaeota bacterium]
MVRQPDSLFVVPPSGGRLRRATTLLELTVAAATAVVVFGIAAGILIATNQLTTQSMGKDSLLQHAQLAMREIHAVIGATVWPEDLATTLSAHTQLVFKKDELAIVSVRSARDGRSSYCRFSNTPTISEKSGESRTAAGYARSDPSTGKAVGGFNNLNMPTDRFASTIRFLYATGTGPDLQPVWKENLAAGERPRLIWLELVARDLKQKTPKGEREEIRVATAVNAER